MKISTVFQKKAKDAAGKDTGENKAADGKTYRAFGENVKKASEGTARNASEGSAKNACEENTRKACAGTARKAWEEKTRKASEGTADKVTHSKIRGRLRRNRMIITAFAVMIAVAGYLNYADRIDSAQSGQGAELEAANAAADAVYENDPLLSSDGDIESLDVDYDLILSEDDLLEEVTETATAGDKDGTGTGSDEETGSGGEDENGADTSDGESGTNETDSADGNSTAEASGETGGIDTANAGDTSDGTNVSSSNIGESLFVSSTGVLTFVAEAKLSREQARAKSKETLLEIVDNDALSESAKQSAIDAMVELSNIAAMEAATETLLAAKGFTNSVVTIQEDSVDVIVNAEQLSDSERAQIEDIITQKTGISVANITIVPLRESEE